jgi:hypothetical protein
VQQVPLLDERGAVGVGVLGRGRCAAVTGALFHSDAEQTIAFAGAVALIATMLLVAAGYARFDTGRKLLCERVHAAIERIAARHAGEAEEGTEGGSC